MNSGAVLNRVFVLLAIPLLAYLAFSTGKKALEVYQLNQQAGQIRQDVAQLKERNTELRRQIDYLRSEEYLEKAAREQLNLVKPGDVPVVVVAPPTREVPQENLPALPPTSRSVPNWQRWWNFFFAGGP